MKIAWTRFINQWQTRTYPSLQLVREVIDDETHGSVKAIAYTRGLKYLLGEHGSP